MFTHFPIALWTIAIASDVISFWAGNTFVRLACYAMAAGCLFAIPTLMAGLFDFTRIHSGTKAKQLALVHGLLMVVVTMYFSVNVWLRSWRMTASHTPALAFGMALVGLGALVVGGWFGQRLVYHYGVNVMTPKIDGLDFEAPTRRRAPVRP